MRDYLKKLKEYLSKRKEELDGLDVSYLEDIKRKKYEELLNIEIVDNIFNKIVKNNSFEMNSNYVMLYPRNDGFSSHPFVFYKDGKKVISNENAYQEIINLDEIILETVRIMNRAFDNYVILDPYHFIIRLDEVRENFNGKATLVIDDKAVKNDLVNNKNFDDARKLFLNEYLDHFIGWNFGVSINRNEILKEELERFNDKVIDYGLREKARDGYEVIGNDNEVSNGLQHYYLKLEKPKVLIK